VWLDYELVVHILITEDFLRIIFIIETDGTKQPTDNYFFGEESVESDSFAWS
jgi:hypothetical protein